MGERKSIRLSTQQLDALEEMERQGDADNQSEALRTALNAGLRDMGYRNGEKADTTLRRNIRRMAHTLAMMAVGMLGVVLVYPVEIVRIAVVAPAVMSVTMYAVDQFLEQYEPAVSRRLARTFKQRQAATDGGEEMN